ncbi:tryptophan synthase beta subunit-like PLP-dependent enzyme [Choiromyces venosus 120613-1]|uniref:Tryptophan synthase beta subunit-like PLP-dependent enzyme n=1 Tax=Choiromyces venosus 120613-1 TaxID=1336337 RepID=A0A3N4JK33_9PEZI|nr:tryptophan synthase beta subunit-like PLP-dependent enzyme [Choiromyces venosus 120613-1]
MSSVQLPLTRESVLEAHALIKSRIHRTPVLTSTTLSKLASPGDTNVNLLFKCENLQKIGAFKIRGATHALARLTDEELQKGVVTHSSGNHAQALALAAREASAARGFNIPCYIVMPRISTPSKIAAAEGYGAQVVFSGSTSAEREAEVRVVQERTGALLVPPYDHAHIVLGQGTMAIELAEQATEDFGMPLDAIIAPCGGGGMLAGVAVACNGTGVRVFGAEPREGADDAWRGLRDGQRVDSVKSLTIADGLRTPVGLVNWGIISDKSYVSGVYTVSEEEIKLAMKLVVERMKILIEPSSAVPVAVALYNEEFREEIRNLARGKDVNLGIIISGGNTTIDKIIELFGAKN